MRDWTAKLEAFTARYGLRDSLTAVAPPDPVRRLETLRLSLKRAQKLNG
jgi:hypothetical protein